MTSLLDAQKAFAVRLNGRMWKTHCNTPEPQRPLHIVYFVGDYEHDPLRFAIEPLLKHHSRCHTHVYCYVTASTVSDLTKRSIPNAGWEFLKQDTSPEDVASMIHEHKTDILVDACGYFGTGIGLEVLSYKPAPIQLVYGTFPGTTGLNATDYILADRDTAPAGSDSAFTEEVMRLSQFCAYAPPGLAPTIVAPPALKNGFITFGSFHRLEKLNSDVIALWARVLRAVPGSRLRLQRKFVDSGFSRSNAAFFRERFAAVGITEDRVEIYGRRNQNRDQYFHDLANVDICLDPFPYNGHTVTCDSLWMGVPVVTKRGRTYAGNIGASLLRSVGLPSLIAEDEQGYVATAVSLASDLRTLEKLRRSMRDRMRRSRLCNGAHFANEVERLYRKVWKRWCAARVARKGSS
jgi:predicted O-linked N-acetylglucosamine transferase (SPINDLY family)